MSKKARTQARRRAAQSQKVSLAPSPWDHGAMGQANRLGLVIEEAGELDPETGKRINPNDVKRARRMDMLEIYARRGWISSRGEAAGMIYRKACLHVDMGGCAPFARERVDSSAKPDATVTVQIDRMSKLIRAGRFIHPDDRRIIDTVAGRGIALGSLREYRGAKHEAGKARLHQAFERLADNMGRS